MNPSTASDPFQAQLQIAHEHRQANRLADAQRIYEAVLARDPAHAGAHFELGGLMQALGKDEAAARHLQAVVTALPQHLDARLSLGASLHRLGRFEESLAQLENTLKRHPGVPEVHNYLGIVYAELSDSQRAERHLLRALKLRPSLADAHKNLGTLYSQLGRVREAKAALKKAIALRPDYANAYWQHANINHFSAYDEDVRAMESFFARDHATVDQRMCLAFGLGKAFHDLGEHSRAFRYWREGNALRRRHWPYDVRPTLAEVRTMQRVFSAELCHREGNAGILQPAPLFIVGMPRSGTSLVEQILASHSAVHGAGELTTLDDLLRRAASNFPVHLKKLRADDWQSIASDYLRRIAALSARARYVTDKMPGNFLHIGTIGLMFPGAKVIHCCRDAMATGLSCFRTLFVSEKMGFTSDLADLGAYHRHYQELMAHWDRVSAARIYDIQYEALVAEPESEIRRLLQFCELPFETGCLSFHENKRPVRTASGLQVRQPIYKDSVQGWRQYEKELRPLKMALQRPWARVPIRVLGVLPRLAAARSLAAGPSPSGRSE